MVQFQPLDAKVPISQQLQTDLAPVILVNLFRVAEADVPALLKAWAQDAEWMKGNRVSFPRSFFKRLPVAPCY